MRTLHEDLILSQEANETQQETIKEMKGQVLMKGSTIQALKGKVAELYVDFQVSIH